MLDFDKKARTADYNNIHEVIRMVQGVTRWDRKRNEGLYKQYSAALCSWFDHVMHGERVRVNDNGCNKVKEEGKETKRKTNTKVARQHR